MENRKRIIGVNVKKFRELKNLDQEGLANLIEKSKDLISRIERGEENVTLDNLLKICTALEIDIEELFLETSKVLSLRLLLSDQNLSTLKALREYIDKALKKEG